MLNSVSTFSSQLPRTGTENSQFSGTQKTCGLEIGGESSNSECLVLEVLFLAPPGLYMCVGQYHLLPAKHVDNLIRVGPNRFSGFGISLHVFGWYPTQVFLYIYNSLGYWFWVGHLRLEGIGFGWASIGFAFKSLVPKTMSSRGLLLTYSNSVGYSQGSPNGCKNACLLPTTTRIHPSLVFLG